jgi:glutathione S-transferase
VKLYYSDVLAPRKTCALIKYLKVPVEFAYLHLDKGEHKKPEYLALNPNGKVPTLVDDDKVLWEADAILCYLAKHAGSDLWPDDARQADIVSWFSWNSQHFIQSGGALYFEFVIKSRFNIGPPDTAAVAKATKSFRSQASVLNNHLKSRKWLVGEQLSVADFSVAVTLPYAAKAEMPLDEFPEMRRWHDQLCVLDGWLDPFPQHS